MSFDSKLKTGRSVVLRFSKSSFLWFAFSEVQLKITQIFVSAVGGRCDWVITVIGRRCDWGITVAGRRCDWGITVVGRRCDWVITVVGRRCDWGITVVERRRDWGITVVGRRCDWVITALVTGAEGPGFKTVSWRDLPKTFSAHSREWAHHSLQSWGRGRRRGRGVAPHLSYISAGTTWLLHMAIG